MMARSISEIYAAIIAEKDAQSTLSALQPSMDDAQTLLTDLSSTSKVAVWRLWAYVIAVQLWIHETLWDNFQAEVEALIAKFRPGTKRWYQEQAFSFQLGYLLLYINGKYQYDINDDAAKIVKRCSVSEPNGEIRIKAAKLVSGVVTPLTNPEISALQAYFQKIKYPGMLTVVSYSADLLKIYMDVYYDPLADLTVLQPAVEAAVLAYVSELPFDGIFNLTALTDKVQAVTGVIDPRLQSVEARYGSLPYATVTRAYASNAGYCTIDTGFPLSATINYIANV